MAKVQVRAGTIHYGDVPCSGNPFHLLLIQIVAVNEQSVLETCEQLNAL